MPEYGKIDADFFAEHIRPHLGADREEIRLGPTAGIDFGILDIGDQRESIVEGDRSLVMATDPLSILPALGFERAARFGLDVVLADVAISGLAPEYISVSFTLPPEMTDEAFATVWQTIDSELTDLGASVVTGHTARYEGCSYPWIGGMTAFAVGDPAEIIRPDGTQPGDRILITNGPGVEAVGLLTTLFGEQMDLPEETLAMAKERLADARTVRDAITAAAAGPVTAMHDATECGLQGALGELAMSANLRLDIDQSTVPMRPGVKDVCSYLDMNPWHASSSGTLLLTAPPAAAETVREAIEDRGTICSIIGTATTGSGVYFDGEQVERPTVDPSWAVYAEYTSTN